MYGARILFSLMLCGAAIPTACTGLVQTPRGLMVLRAFIGLAGGTFVTTEYWTSTMFVKEIVGTANGLVAGWGNLGASVTQIVMASFLFPVFTNMYDGDAEKAWRMVSLIPAAIGFITGVIIYFISDDAPKGNYAALKKHGVMENVSGIRSFVVASLDINTWVLFIQYACCFGVELTMNTAAALYFRVRVFLYHKFDTSLFFSWFHLNLIVLYTSHRMSLVNLQSQRVLLHQFSDG